MVSSFKMKDWKQDRKTKLLQTKLFDIHEVEFSSQTSNRKGTFDVLETSDWVNVVALTTDQKVLMVQQFRFGIEEITLEFPAGKVDPGEKPEQTALRELREETGGISEKIFFSGKTQANPAFLNNYCYHFVVRDVKLEKAPDLDTNEELEMKYHSIEEIDFLIESGRISHSLSICAWFYFKQHLNR